MRWWCRSTVRSWTPALFPSSLLPSHHLSVTQLLLTRPPITAPNIAMATTAPLLHHRPPRPLLLWGRIFPPDDEQQSIWSASLKESDSGDVEGVLVCCCSSRPAGGSCELSRSSLFYWRQNHLSCRYQRPHVNVYKAKTDFIIYF